MVDDRWLLETLARSDAHPALGGTRKRQHTVAVLECLLTFARVITLELLLLAASVVILACKALVEVYSKLGSTREPDFLALPGNRGPWLALAAELGWTVLTETGELRGRYGALRGCIELPKSYLGRIGDIDRLFGLSVSCQNSTYAIRDGVGKCG